VTEGFVENRIPQALTLHFGHFKAFSGKRTSSFSSHEPIHKVSYFIIIIIFVVVELEAGRFAEVVESFKDVLKEKISIRLGESFNFCVFPN